MPPNGCADNVVSARFSDENRAVRTKKMRFFSLFFENSMKKVRKSAYFLKINLTFDQKYRILYVSRRGEHCAKPPPNGKLTNKETLKCLT